MARPPASQWKFQPEEEIVSTLGVTFRQWTQAECVRAAELWQAHVVDHYGEDEVPRGVREPTVMLIADELKRTRDSISDRLRKYGPSFGGNQFRGAAASPRALAERDAREEASRRQPPISALMGDPPPGYSALDRKRRGLAP
jgi:hypothetical protein